MKKNLVILIIVAVLIFAFGILVSSVMRAVPINSFRFERNLVLAKTSTPSVLPTPTPEINYYLSYPGILPDHSLYLLKMVRDRLVLLSTTDPL